tara:strand:+ start:1735 stop:2604 length:870 start_codon:yes stop_codon:yes gene_type:complete
MNRKGIILAGGMGTRLYPATISVCKQLLPVYDKPLIFYPLSTLMTAGIREILIICTPSDINLFRDLFGNGSNLGISIDYAEQSKPNGIAEAFIIGKEFLNNSPSCLILGDNIFYGNDLTKTLTKCNQDHEGATIMGYRVNDPQMYGVIEFDNNNEIVKIEEKPLKPKSNIAVTGIYFYDNTVSEKAKSLSPSKRNELEITDLNNLYLNENKLKYTRLNRGSAWLDTGTHENLLEASQFIRAIEKRQGIKIACLEEISLRFGWINQRQVDLAISKYKNSSYGSYLSKINQ